MYLGSRVTYKKEHKVVTSEISSVRPKIYRIKESIRSIITPLDSTVALIDGR